DPERLDPDLDPEDDPGEDLEAMIELADHAFGAESFGITAEEQVQGESLDQRLAEERPDGPTRDVEIAIEDVDAPDHEPQMVGEAVVDRDPLVAPEEAALTIRDRAPGGVDHEDDYVDLDESGETS
ncbi:MAG: hypothetical protein ACXWEJ_09150, partial [Actinomycetota bacterium]